MVNCSISMSSLSFKLKESETLVLAHIIPSYPIEHLQYLHNVICIHFQHTNNVGTSMVVVFALVHHLIDSNEPIYILDCSMLVVDYIYFLYGLGNL